MTIEFPRRYRSRFFSAAAFFLLTGFAADSKAQLTVEGFPELEPTDYSYVNAETIAMIQDEALQRSARPFKMFDNLYFIGITWVGGLLVVTTDGLILIGSLHEPYVETGVEQIRELGFDPADIKYVIGAHGHLDHMGGHAHYKRTFGSTVGLAAADWKRAQADAGHELFGMEVPDVDWVIQDGDTLELGEQTITFYVTPGHTEGVLSMELTVRDGDDAHRAVIFGGEDSLTDDFWRYQTVLGNIRRFKALAAQSPPFTVQLSLHPNGPGSAPPGRSFLERRDRLSARTPGEPHPFVDDPGSFVERLEQAERNIERAIMELP